MKATRPTKSKLALLILPLVAGMSILGSEVASAVTMETNTNSAGGWGTNNTSTNFWSGGTAFNDSNWKTAALGSNYGAVFTNTSGSIAFTTANIYLNALQYTPTAAGNNFTIGAAAGQGTLNFTGAGAYLSVASGSETLTLNSKLIAASSMGITNNATLVISNLISVSANQTLTISGTGTTFLANTANEISVSSGANLIISNTFIQYTNNANMNISFGAGTTTIANATVNGGGSGNGFNPLAGGTIIVSGGGIITNTQYKSPSGGSANSTLILTNGGSVYQSTTNSSAPLSMGRSDINNRILIGSTVAGQTSVYNVKGQIGIGYTAAAPSSNNLILVAGGGLLTNFTGAGIGGIGLAQVNNSYNQIIVTNGGVAVNTNAANSSVYIGYSTNDNTNSLIVTGPGSFFNANTNAFYVGYVAGVGASNYGNYMLVANGGVLSNATAISIDNSNSYVSISGGTVYANSVLFSNSTASLILSNNGSTNGALIATANGNLISGSGTVSIAGNGELDAGGFTVTNTANVTGSGTLTVNGNANGNLGAGNLTLSGSNSFGELNVAGGTLVAGSSNALGSGTASVNGGTLQIASTGVTNQINANGGTVNFNGAGTNSPSGKVNLNAGGSLTVGSGGGNTLTIGTLTLNGGILNLAVTGGGTSDLINSSTLSITANSYVTLTGYSNGVTYTILSNAAGISLGSYTLQGANMGHNSAVFAVDGSTISATVSTAATRWNGTSGNWSSGWDKYSPTLQGDAAILDATGSVTPNVLVDTSAVAGSIIFSNASVGYNIGSVTSSNLALNNGNNASTVTVQAGNHTISEGTSITNGVIFNETNASSLTMAGTITGSGGLIQSGQGTLILGASNSYSGATTVNGGTVIAANAKALGAGALNVASGTVNNGSFNSTVGVVTLGNGTISGNGTLTGTSFTAMNTGSALVSVGLAGSVGFTNNGAGTTTLAGTNTYTGTTVVNSGSTLVVSGLLGNGSYATNITLNASTLILGNSSAQTLSGTISGSGTLVNSGSGATTLGTNYTFTNVTINNSGSLTASTNFYMNGGSGGTVFNNTGSFSSAASGAFRMQAGTNILNLLGGTATFNGLNEGSSAGTNLITVSSNATMTFSNGISVGYSGTIGSNVMVVNAGGNVSSPAGTFYLNQSFLGAYAALTNNGTITMNGDFSLNSQKGSNNTAILIQTAGSFTGISNILVGGGNVTYNAGMLFLTNSLSLVDVSGGSLSASGAVTLGQQGFNNTNTFTVEGTGTATVGSINLGSTDTLYRTATGTQNGGTYMTNTSFVTNVNGQQFAAYVQSTYTNTNSGSPVLSVLVTNIFTNMNTLNIGTGAQGGTLVVNKGISVGGVSVGFGTNDTNMVGGIASGNYLVNWNGGTLRAGGSSSTFFTNSPFTTVTLGTSGGTFDAAGYNDTISQVLSGPGALKVVSSTGSGTLTLTGNNSYQGGTVVNGGSLSLTNGSALGTGSVTLTGNGVLSLDGNAAVTVGNDVTVTSGGFTGSIVNNTGFTAGLTGTLTKNNAILKLLKGSFNVSGNIVGSAPNSDLYVSSGANATLSGNNTYNGPTHVDTGSTLVLGSATALPANTDLVLGSALLDSASQVNRLDLASYNAAVASLTASGPSTNIVTSSVGSATLTLTGDLTVANTSTLSLGVPVLGAANVNLNGGTLLLNAGSSINPTANLNMAGGTLAVGLSSPSFSNLTLTGNSVINFAGLTPGTTLTFSGIANLNGHTLTIDNYVPGSSHLNFTSLTPNLADADLLNIQFFSDNGLTSLGSAGGSFSGTEIVPVPEPSVVFAAFLMVALMAFAKREQLSRLARRVAVR